MYTAKDMLPLYTVEKPEFIQMLKVLDAANILSELAMPQLYYCTLQRIVASREEVSIYSTTTDLLISRAMKP